MDFCELECLYNHFLKMPAYNQEDRHAGCEIIVKCLESYSSDQTLQDFYDDMECEDKEFWCDFTGEDYSLTEEYEQEDCYNGECDCCYQED